MKLPLNKKLMTDLYGFGIMFLLTTPFKYFSKHEFIIIGDNRKGHEIKYKQYLLMLIVVQNKYPILKGKFSLAASHCLIHTPWQLNSA